MSYFMGFIQALYCQTYSTIEYCIAGFFVFRSEAGI